MAFYEKSEDESVLALIKEVIQARPTYGYKRVTAMVNQKSEKTFNKKRIHRIMKKNGMMLPQSQGQKRPHTGTGKVMTLHSNTRWCSDGFEIRCWNDEKVYVAFVLDCKDREAIAYTAKRSPLLAEDIGNIMIQSVEKRFGKLKTDRIIEFLSDRGAIYRAYETQRLARRLGLKSCYTAPYSPSSNGMAEAFVGTFKRDYVYVNDCQSAQWVLDHLAEWFNDYNCNAPHSALGMKSPMQYQNQVRLGVN